MSLKRQRTEAHFLLKHGIKRKFTAIFSYERPLVKWKATLVEIRLSSQTCAKWKFMTQRSLLFNIEIYLIIVQRRAIWLKIDGSHPSTSEQSASKKFLSNLKLSLGILC